MAEAMQKSTHQESWRSQLPVGKKNLCLPFSLIIELQRGENESVSQLQVAITSQRANKKQGCFCPQDVWLWSGIHEAKHAPGYYEQTVTLWVVSNTPDP